MKILKGKRKAFFDVFFGDGWENWSRYRDQNGKLIHLAGRQLTKHELKEVGHVYANS